MRINAPHTEAARCVKQNVPLILGLILINLAARFVAVAPFALNQMGVIKNFAGKLETPAYLLMLTLPLYAVAVSPAKLYTRSRYYRLLTDRRDEALSDLFVLALLKTLLILPYVAPLFALLGGFYYLWNIGNFTELPNLIRAFGEKIGGDYLHGAAISGVLVLLAFILAYIGFRRYTAMDYLSHLPMSPAAMIRQSRELMKKNRSALNRATLINLLIALPPVILGGGALLFDLKSVFTDNLTYSLMFALTKLLALDFSPTAAAVLGLSCALYIALIPLRKTALAACLK